MALSSYKYPASFHSGFGRAGTSGGGNLTGTFKQLEQQARASNLAREKEIRGYLSELIELNKPGSAYHKSQLADIERKTKQGIAKEQQGLISSGLFGTTTATSTPYRWEKGYAEPARMTLENYMQERYAKALGNLAGFVERIEEPYPDYNLLFQASQAEAQRGGSPVISGRVVNNPNPVTAWMYR